jgi:hypothetical protein
MRDDAVEWNGLEPKTWWFQVVGLVAVALGVGFCVTMAVVSVYPASPVDDTTRRGSVPSFPAGGEDVQPLLAKIAGSRLIRGARIQAAVKDSGAAGRLVKRLRLQGVIQAGSGPMAYILVDKDPAAKAVHEGESVLDFVVEKIEPSRVTLSLEGVEVVLGH